MQIKKTTPKYAFYQEGVNYVLELGIIKRGENTRTELLITGVEDSNELNVKSTCGCSSIDKEIVDVNTQKVTISYNDCAPSFAKIMEIKYKSVTIGTIKVRGTCS